MNITLPPEQEAFIRSAIGSGRLACAEDAVSEALLMWEARETKRAAFRASLDEARDSMARGEGRKITHDSMTQLAAEHRGSSGELRVLVGQA